MGFNKVYQCLLDIFPQVDSRILKAIAIENSKDVDAAAEIVLSEIMPYLSTQTVVASSSTQNQIPRVQASEDAAVNDEKSNQLRQQEVSSDKRVVFSIEPLSEINEEVRDTHLTGAASNMDSLVAPKAATTSKFQEKNNNEAVDIETEELILLGNAGSGKDKSNVSFNALVIENSMPHKNSEIKEAGSSSKNQAIGIEDELMRTSEASLTMADQSTFLRENTGSSGSSNDDGSVYLSVDSYGCSSLNVSMVGEKNGVAPTVPSSSQELMQEGPKAGPHSQSGSVIHSNEYEKQERGSVELKPQHDSDSEMGDIEDDTFNPVVGRSNQTCGIDLLEESIEDAKNNKKSLFQAMQSVMNLMKEVELQEEAAEKAKEEAARGGLDILVKVEELKQMLPHAKEANDMHAGEIYGEKAILATEVRELQSRLLSLSEKRDESLAILDEMRKTLEARQASANELMKAAQQEKLEREESARSALAEQEAIMAKVVEESKILQQEAEENSKLREFLMDCGQIVDSLQGEIFVICEDVRLLKDNFDERTPLSKSISSSQTTCILASSGSSLESMTSDLGIIQAETAKTLDDSSPTPCADWQPLRSASSDEIYKADGKELSDDGWEIFDRDAEF